MLKNESNKAKIEANILDGTILTPLACTNVISELIKCLIYEKSQIPYPYSHLKKVITKKRSDDKLDGENNLANMTLQSQFRIASKAYDVLEEFFACIDVELKNSKIVVDEVLILFGSTYNIVKEAYSIVMPKLQHYHNEYVHSTITQKNVKKILRSILFSETWTQSMDRSIPVTNMYFLVKKTDEVGSNNSSFMPIDYKISPKVNYVSINVNYDYSVEETCCSKQTVFTEYEGIDTNSSESDEINKVDIVDSTLEKKWYLANIFLKGYKDYYINKVSASELW